MNVNSKALKTRNARPKKEENERESREEEEEGREEGGEWFGCGSASTRIAFARSSAIVFFFSFLVVLLESAYI
jgi:hypothetical protein